MMNQGTLLIVEDDTNLLTGIEDILELEGYMIHTAIHGLAGLEALQEMEVPPDLIVSDIMMPHMDGIEFLKKVRQVERFVSIPFIFLTAKGEKADIQRGKELGVDDYVVKPFNAEDLLVAIRSRLGRSREIAKVQQGQQDALKKNILTILNHEFRTPLTFVVAYSDMLGDAVPTAEKNTPSPDNAEMLTFLEGVRTGADRLRRLIENFILLVELQTGSAHKNLQWRQRKLDLLTDVVSNGVEQAKMIPDKPRTCDLDFPADLPKLVGDADYLQAVITHLLDNAFKFSKPGTLVKVSAHAADAEIVITVADEGRGIPLEEIDNIWEPFYQIDRAYHEDQGAGSGLYIVKSIVEMHGGEISVESQIGVGSTFTVRLPLTHNLSVAGEHA